MDSTRHLTPGRLRRLAEELIEENLGSVGRVELSDVLIDEIDYAMRPPRHERRIPSYGSFVLPESAAEDWSQSTNLEVVVSSTIEQLDDDARRYADGLTSWTIRTANGVDALVVFDRPAGSERDLVIMASASGATLVQRHPSGEVRLVGAFGVARWDGFIWQVEPPVDDWLAWASCGIADEGSEVLGGLLRFAVHDLGAQGIGALLVYRPTDPAGPSFERRLPTPPRLKIERPSDLAPLRHVLSQLDGAALFDERGHLIDLGVRLVTSAKAETAVAPLGGTRHTSARRFSHDDPRAVVVAVSESGPVTVFRRGEIIGRSE